MTLKNRFSYKITGKKALQLKIIFDEDNLSIDWSKKRLVLLNLISILPY